MRRRSFLAALAMTALSAAATPGAAQEAAVDFSGQTIEILVPADAGGGSDVYARIFAPFWTRYLPGNPNVVIRNMAGGGQIVGANFFDARAPSNGRMIYVTSGSTHFPYLLQDNRARYQMSEWVPISTSPGGAVVFVASELGVESWENAADLAGRQLVFASQGPTSLDMAHALSFELLGFDVQHVFGFTGRGPGRVAFERREATIDAQTTPAYLTNVTPLVDEGSATPLYALGALDGDGNIVRDPTFPDLPSFPELYEHVHGAPPSGPMFEVWRSLFIAGFGAQKHNVLPAGTAPEIVETYRNAAAQIVADPEFQAAAAAELGEYEQFLHEDAVELWELTTTFSDENRAWIAEWLQERFGARL